MIRLDKRLCAVAAMVRQGSIMADIGSDHGYLACGLVQNGTCPRAYACDIADGPLSRTRATIERYGLAGRVEAILSDGLTALSDMEIDDIVIAGMGGETIAEIIANAPWIHREGVHFVLQPMTKADRLRKWLLVNGFEIQREDACACGRFVYTILSAIKAGEGKCLYEHDYGRRPVQ
jgi:tRNA (adenine22-N1)-methyltransferase